MRVWLAPSAFFPHRGGVEELTLKMAQHLSRCGDDVAVVTNRHPPSLPEDEEVEGISVHRVAFTAPGRRPNHVLHHLRAQGQIDRDLAAVGEPPDLVHVICPSTQLGPVARQARQLGVPLVITSQGETEMDAGRLYQRSRWMRATLRRAAGDAAALTACSRWTAVAAARVAPEFTSSLVIPNGVDPQDWAGMPTPPKSPVVAAWGRMVPQKGFDLLLAAWPLVRERVPDAQLRLGGSGPEQSRLSALAGEGVELLGSLDRAGVRALLQSARVAVIPSRIEPFGIVALEALAAGRGLVYSAGTGLAEAAGSCGRPANVRDAEELATAIVDELESPTTSEAGRVRGEELSWTSLVGKYRDLYRKLLGD